jgi:hypothetical protein
MQIGIDSLVAAVPDSLTGQGKTYKPSPTLSGICIGPSTVVASSVQLSWDGFLLERQIASSEMLIGNDADRDLLAMLCSPVMKGEHRTKSGGLVPIRKTSGAITVIPQGPVPELQLLAETELAGLLHVRTGFYRQDCDPDGRKASPQHGVPLWNT